MCEPKQSSKKCNRAGVLVFAAQRWSEQGVFYQKPDEDGCEDVDEDVGKMVAGHIILMKIII